MSEEELPRAPRERRVASSGGMSIGAKVGLLCGLATLVMVAIVVFGMGAVGGGGTEADPARKLGTRTVAVLGAFEPGLWTGKSTSSKDGMKALRRDFKRLFGEEGLMWWDDKVAEITNMSVVDQMDADEKREHMERLDEYKTAEKTIKTGGASGKTDTGSATMRLNKVVESAGIGDHRLLGAWVTKGRLGAKGEWLAGSLEEAAVSYDPTSFVLDGRIGETRGSVQRQGDTYDVRIFATQSGLTGSVTNYVAVWSDPAAAGGSSGSNPLGIAMLLLAPLVVGGLAFGLANGHAQGVRSLTREIDRLGTHGDPTRNLHGHGAEASGLARAVERMVANLEFRSKHDDADMDEVVSKEQKVAQEIHHALMSKNPPRLSNYEVETLFKPGYEIGGDHFEYFAIDQNHLGVILLDTNVRGIQAALVMSAAKAYVRAAAPGNLSPAEVLRIVNRNLAGDLPRGRHVTALYAVIDIAQGKCTIASAGHLPLIVYRHSEGKVFKVNPEGLAMGLDKGPVFDKSLDEGDIPLGVGDRIVLYTDGALKIQNADGEEYGEARFHQAVSQKAPMNSQAFVNFVGSGIDQFHLDAPQNDDITISTVKRLK